MCTHVIHVLSFYRYNSLNGTIPYEIQSFSNYEVRMCAHTSGLIRHLQFQSLTTLACEHSWEQDKIHFEGNELCARNTTAEFGFGSFTAWIPRALEKLHMVIVADRQRCPTPVRCKCTQQVRNARAHEQTALTKYHICVHRSQPRCQLLQSVRALNQLLCRHRW